MVEELAMNGVDRSHLYLAHPVVPEHEALLQPMSTDPNVLFVGQLIRGKGVDLLLRSLALLKSPWRAKIAGDGNARQSLEELAKTLRIDDRVEFLGWFPGERARELYDQARVLAVPARWPEPFGMIGVEAMRRARPVVGFRVGGIPDWLVDNETGYLVDAQDVAAFADRLVRLLTDVDLATTMGNRGFEIAKCRFGFGAYIDRLEKILGAQR
jgi:glycosyltransferase involved in cell wall biosynthesis